MVLWSQQKKNQTLSSNAISKRASHLAGSGYFVGGISSEWRRLCEYDMKRTRIVRQQELHMDSFFSDNDYK